MQNSDEWISNDVEYDKWRENNSSLKQNYNHKEVDNIVRLELLSSKLSEINEAVCYLSGENPAYADLLNVISYAATTAIDKLDDELNALDHKDK